eukprot:2089283-Rhodomonas_salina.1
MSSTDVRCVAPHTDPTARTQSSMLQCAPGSSEKRRRSVGHKEQATLHNKPATIRETWETQTSHVTENMSRYVA